MAASRASSLRALKHISKSTSTVTQQSRGLRITQHVEASPYLTTQKPSLTRVQAAIDDAAAEKSKATAAAPSRQFNTSRSLKAVNDSSTIDFAYLPDFDPDAGMPAPTVRVPLLPESLYPQSTKTNYTKEEEEIVMRPEISLASADSTHVAPPSAFTDVVDNNAIDFEGVASALKSKAGAVVEETSEIKRLFNGLLDDIFGAKKTA
ncbi:uncharacterized protein PV09_03805 [Verruconis gallopava]|uniref:Uncharacterized protein n=1 Tax=Verruconis gallopava TaxID=253628 RepID=A0A0D2AE59_9PEZI|nr:uncharacterized protein PV09_03805 [Verruconis gallopava]KIW05273.1 hypothetical protein PV09_03805 [Verruconis gallopava]